MAKTRRSASARHSPAGSGTHIPRTGRLCTQFPRKYRACSLLFFYLWYHCIYYDSTQNKNRQSLIRENACQNGKKQFQRAGNPRKKGTRLPNANASSLPRFSSFPQAHRPPERGWAFPSRSHKRLPPPMVFPSADERRQKRRRTGGEYHRNSAESFRPQTKGDKKKTGKSAGDFPVFSVSGASEPRCYEVRDCPRAWRRRSYSCRGISA